MAFFAAESLQFRRVMAIGTLKFKLLEMVTEESNFWKTLFFLIEIVRGRHEPHDPRAQLFDNVERPRVNFINILRAAFVLI